MACFGGKCLVPQKTAQEMPSIPGLHQRGRHLFPGFPGRVSFLEPHARFFALFAHSFPLRLPAVAIVYLFIRLIYQASFHESTQNQGITPGTVRWRFPGFPGNH